MRRNDPSQNLYYSVKRSKKNNELIETPSTMLPSELKAFDGQPDQFPWLQADNQDYPNANRAENPGKWIVFVDPSQIDEIWLQIKKEIKDGSIWQAKVTHSNEEIGKYVILFSVPNINDTNAISSTLNTLRKAGIVKKDQVIKFKSDEQTRSNEYGEDAYLFKSNDARFNSQENENKFDEDTLSTKKPLNKNPLNDDLIDADADEDSDESRVDNSHPPGILIAQQLDGVEPEKTIATSKNELDEQNSQIYGTSVYANYVAGKNVGKAKNTDDKIVIGYTSDGLPFQIVVDGFYKNGNTKAIFEFIKQHVTPLMDNYAEKLSQSENPEETIKNLIRTIYTLRETYSPGSDFTMSIGITYEKDNKLHFAGFGIGDTGLVLRKSSGEIQQLTHTTSVNKFKDAFDNFSVNNAGIERVIDRNSVFDVPVNSGDEIFGYTYLCDNLLSEENRSEDSYKVKLVAI